VVSGANLTLDNWKENTTTRCIAGARCSVQYLNRSAFTLVPVNAVTRIAVRPGNAANGIVRVPSTWGVDMQVSKNFRVAEKMNLQIRADMFNFFNHVNYNGPNTDITSASFGEINGAGGMRVVQFNARFSF